jgi:hypothetical protein
MKLVGLMGVLVAAMAGCSGEDEGTCEVEGGEACFEAPTAALVAWQNGASSAPSLTCAKPEPTNATQSVALGGLMRQYTAATPIAGVTIDAYSSIDMTTLVFTSTTGSDGTFSGTIPIGSPDTLHIKVTGSAILPGFALYQKYDVTTPSISDLVYYGPTQSLIDLIETTTRTDQDVAKTAIAAVVKDCDGKNLEHAIVTVSSTSKTATHVAGVNVLYGPAGDLPLPVVRSERADTNDNGAVALLNVPASGTLYVQAWGYLAAGDVAKGTAGLKLLAEWPIVTVAGGAVAMPIRSFGSP